MREYKVAIFRDSHCIIEADLDADAVIEIFRGLRTGEATSAPFTDQQLFPKRKYKKRVAHAPKPKSPRGRELRAGGKGCSECGSPGRHKKDCSRAGGAAKTKMVGNDEWKDLGEVSAPRERAMSRMTFGRVKIAHSHDIPPETIASNLDEPEAEVTKAIEAETYDDYLKA